MVFDAVAQHDRHRHDAIPHRGPPDLLAGLCPRLDESAGKRRSTRTRQSAPWLKPTLITAAWAATRKKDGYLRAQFLRIKSRRGAKKAIFAVASSMLTAAYYNHFIHSVRVRCCGKSRSPRGTFRDENGPPRRRSRNPWPIAGANLASPPSRRGAQCLIAESFCGLAARGRTRFIVRHREEDDSCHPSCTRYPSRCNPRSCTTIVNFAGYGQVGEWPVHGSGLTQRA
jgi:hypothetical protein